MKIFSQSQSGGSSSLPDPVTESHGGTNQTTYAKGDIIHATATNTLGKLAVGTQGQILRVNSTGTLQYFDYIDPSNLLVLYDDFLLGSPQVAGFGTDWRYAASGAGAAVLTNLMTSWANNKSGVMAVSTGTTNTGKSCLFSDERNGLYLGSGLTFWETCIAVSAVSDGTDTYTLTFGIQPQDSALGAVANGVYFSYTHSANGGKVLFNVAKASTTTTLDTGITPVANTSMKFGFSIDAALSSIQCYANGSAVGSPITTNIPLSSTAMNIQAGIIKSAGTTSRAAGLDYVKLFMQFSR